MPTRALADSADVDPGTSAGIIPPAGAAVWAQLDRATAVSERHVAKSFFKHNGNSAQVPAEIEMLRAAATGNLPSVSVRKPRVACEVGFNAGHSAVVWLEGLETQLKTFDLFKLPYSNASRHWIDEQYPGRVAFYKGDSAETVPRYVARVDAGLEPRCDVWFVDGLHSKAGRIPPQPLADLRNALLSASHGATIIADDCTRRFPAVPAAWRSLLSTGTIKDAFNVTHALRPPAGLKGWCVGRYEPRRCVAHGKCPPPWLDVRRRSR